MLCSTSGSACRKAQLLSRRVGGCYDLEGIMSGPCNIIGNPDLEPERSVNTELGIGYTNDDAWNTHRP